MSDKTLSVVGLADGRFLPDGRFVYTTNDGTVGLYDLDTDSSRSFFLGGDLADLTTSADGRYVYVAQQEVTLLSSAGPDPIYEAVVHELDLSAGTVSNFIFETNDNGQLGHIDVELAGEDLVVLADYTAWGPLLSINIETGNPTGRDDLDLGNLRGGSFLTGSTDGRHLLIQEGGTSRGPFYVYDVENDSVVGTQDYRGLRDLGFGSGSGYHRLEGAVSSVAGKVALSLVGSVALLDLELNPSAELDLAGGAGYFRGLAFSADGSRLYAVSNVANAVLAYDVATLDFLGGYGLPAVDLYGYSEWTELFVTTDGSRMAVLEGRDWTDEPTDIFIFDIASALTPDAEGGNFGADTWVGSFGDDILTADVDRPSYEEPGQWLLSGGDGADVLYGGLGTDRLSGDRGNDRLLGGGGADTLDGGAGQDIFAMRGDSGRDDIIDFELGVDMIEIAGVQDISQLSILRVGDYVTISWGTGKSIRLIDFEGTLRNSDFRFVDASDDNDEVFGLATRDELNGLLGDDTMFGEGGDDLLVGDGGSDLLLGGDGNDVIYGDAVT